MFENDECVPTLYAILIFSVQLLLSAGGSAKAETLYFAGGAAGQPAVNLQQGTVPLTNLGAGLAACFDPKPHFNPNGKTSMNMYVAEQSIATEIDKTMHWSRDFDLSVDVPTIFNGKASFSDSIQNITTSNFSETSVVLVVEVNAATGFDTPETWVMGDNGKKNLETGNSTFLRHCGVLIATQVDRSAHFYIVITIHTTSNFVKQDILTKFKYDGSLKVYDVVGGGNTTAGDFDFVISQTNGVVSANLQIAATSEKAMAGLGELVQNLNGLADVKSHPIGSAINAAGAFLKSHADDKGAIDIVHLLPINFIVPSIPYDKHLSERFDYARTLKEVRTSFEAIAAISDPTGGMLRSAGDASVFDSSKTSILQGLKKFYCNFSDVIDDFVLDAICGSPDGHRRAPINSIKILRSIDNMIEDCFITDDNDYSDDTCKSDNLILKLIQDGALFPASQRGLATQLDRSQLEKLEAKFPDKNVDKLLSNPAAILNSGDRAVVLAALEFATEKFPELRSVDSLNGIRDGFSSKAFLKGGRALFEEIVPTKFTATRLPHAACAFKDKPGETIVFKGDKDYAHDEDDIFLNFSGAVVVTGVSVYSPTKNVRGTVKFDDASEPLDIFVWLLSDCGIQSEKGTFDLKGHVTKTIGGDGIGEISIFYRDLFGDHSVAVQNVEMRKGQLLLTDVFHTN